MVCIQKLKGDKLNFTIESEKIAYKTIVAGGLAVALTALASIGAAPIMIASGAFIGTVMTAGSAEVLKVHMKSIHSKTHCTGGRMDNLNIFKIDHINRIFRQALIHHVVDPSTLYNDITHCLDEDHKTPEKNALQILALTDKYEGNLQTAYEEMVKYQLKLIEEYKRVKVDGALLSVAVRNAGGREAEAETEDLGVLTEEKENNTENKQKLEEHIRELIKDFIPLIDKKSEPAEDVNYQVYKSLCTLVGDHVLTYT
jgi:hypothetical protein